MESRIRRVLLTAVSTSVMVAAIDSPQALAAQRGLSTAQDPGLEPNIVRTDLQENEIDSENIEVGIYAGQLATEDFGTNPVVGATLTFHATEDFFFEAAYAKSKTQETSAERLDPLVNL